MVRSLCACLLNFHLSICLLLAQRFFPRLNWRLIDLINSTNPRENMSMALCTAAGSIAKARSPSYHMWGAILKFRKSKDNPTPLSWNKPSNSITTRQSALNTHAVNFNSRPEQKMSVSMRLWNMEAQNEFLQYGDDRSQDCLEHTNKWIVALKKIISTTDRKRYRFLLHASQNKYRPHPGFPPFGSCGSMNHSAGYRRVNKLNSNTSVPVQPSVPRAKLKQ